MAKIQEIDLVRCRLSKQSQEPFGENDEIDHWETPNVVMKFIRRVPVITPAFATRFKDHYNSAHGLFTLYNGV